MHEFALNSTTHSLHKFGRLKLTSIYFYLLTYKVTCSASPTSSTHFIIFKQKLVKSEQQQAYIFHYTIFLNGKQKCLSRSPYVGRFTGCIYLVACTKGGLISKRTSISFHLYKNEQNY